MRRTKQMQQELHKHPFPWKMAVHFTLTVCTATVVAFGQQERHFLLFPPHFTNTEWFSFFQWNHSAEPPPPGVPEQPQKDKPPRDGGQAGCFKPRGAVPNHEGGGGGGRGTLSGPQGSDPDKNGEICKNSTEFTELTQEQWQIPVHRGTIT
jgi:hypothetical protein